MVEPINLFKEPKRFGELPKRVKLAIAALFAGWLAHFVLIFSQFQGQWSEPAILQHGALAMISCYVLLRLKNWARILCITGNAIVILFYLTLVAALIGGGVGSGLAVLTLLNLFLFGASTFYLWSAESADFFKRQSAKPSPSNR